MKNSKSNLSKRERFLYKQKKYFISKNLKFITLDIAFDYMVKANNLKSYSDEYMSLRKEMIDIYGITEIQAINILNGELILIKDYCNLYDEIKNFNEKEVSSDLYEIGNYEEPDEIELPEENKNLNLFDSYYFDEDDD